MLRDDLKEIAGNVGLDLVHYTPVWLFVGQELEPFSIGPVRFFPREAWADEVGTRLGSDPEWGEPLALLWGGATTARRVRARWREGAAAWAHSGAADLGELVGHFPFP